MSETWMPSDERIELAWHRTEYRGGGRLCSEPIRSLIRTAVEKRDAEWMEADRIATARHASELQKARLEAKIELFDEFVLCECGDLEDGPCGPCKQRAQFHDALAALAKAEAK